MIKKNKHMSTIEGGGAWRSDPRWDGGSEETGSQADVRRPRIPLPGLEPQTEAGRSINNVQQGQSSRQKGVVVWYVAETGAEIHLTMIWSLLHLTHSWTSAEGKQVRGRKKEELTCSRGPRLESFLLSYDTVYTLCWVSAAPACSTTGKYLELLNSSLEKKRGFVLQCASLQLLSQYTQWINQWEYKASCFHVADEKTDVFSRLYWESNANLYHTCRYLSHIVARIGGRPFLVFRKHNRFCRYHKQRKSHQK